MEIGTEKFFVKNLIINYLDTKKYFFFDLILNPYNK